MATAPHKRGLTDHIYEQLKNQLFESRYGRDDWLPVEEIASEMNASRQPVMDALKRLAYEGFVNIVPQVGCRVRAYSSEEIHDFFLLFAFGEGLVAELAAQRATAEDIITLRIISEQVGHLGGKEVSKPDLARMYRGLNRRLHKEIRRIARSTSVTELVESMGDRSDFFVATSGRPMFAETLRSAHEEHQAVISAISEHDGRAAFDAMRHHILETDLRLQGFLQSPGHAAAAASSLAAATK